MNLKRSSIVALVLALVSCSKGNVREEVSFFCAIDVFSERKSTFAFAPLLLLFSAAGELLRAGVPLSGPFRVSTPSLDRGKREGKR